MARFPRSIGCAFIAAAASLLSYAAQGEASIYRCVVGGVVTFADRPCGAEATTYQPDIDRVSSYTAPPAPSEAPSMRSSTKKRTTARSSTAANQVGRAAECDRIQTALRDIRAKMRAGYNAKEGERLKARQAKLNDRRRAQRCR